MGAYLVQITVVKCNTHPSNDMNYFKMLYVIVIMLRGLFQALLIKYNPISMVEIDMCLWRVLYWNILMQDQKLTSILIHHNINVMQCFTLFNIIIANRMLPLLLHTANDWFYCSKIKIINKIIYYNIGKHWWFCLTI